MEISEIIMETFTLGTAIGLNMTHNVSFWAESVNAAAWSRARLAEAKLSCFCWCINALMKSTRLESFQTDHGKRVWFTSEASIWKCFVWLRQERSNIYSENYQLYILNSIGKTTSLPNVWGQTLAEQLPRHTMGIVISIMCDIDKWF